MPLQQTSLWYCAAITAAESARLIATEVGLDGAPSYRHVILESQHVAIETHGGAIPKPSENLSDCGTAPYHRFLVVRDEGGFGPVALSPGTTDTAIQNSKSLKLRCVPRSV